MINTTTLATPFIQSATSDDGRISYSPIANDAVLIDGMPAWRGEFIEANGRVAGRFVDVADWQAACALMHEVDALNTATHARLRNENDARIDARNAAADAAFAKAPTHLRTASGMVE